jgi:hypothetical protein
MYQSISGDQTIIAYVDNATWARRMGVMMRASLASNSPAICLFDDEYPGYNGTIRLATRTTTGAAMTLINGPVLGLPAWLKLVRSGNTFTGYSSLDGVTWTTVGTSTITMTDPIYTGLAVTTVSTDTLGTVDFYDVSVTP